MNKWIKTSESLPKIGETVLIFLDDKIFTAMIPYIHDGNIEWTVEGYDDWYMVSGEYIKYWKYLPQFPEIE